MLNFGWPEYFKVNPLKILVQNVVRRNAMQIFCNFPAIVLVYIQQFFFMTPL